MFEGLDLGGMSKMMEQMQEKAKQMQEQAKNVQFTAKAGGGLVSVTVNGAGEVIDVNIDDSLLEDKSALHAS
ncbi:MAG: nucleoid-associated protein, YbaB/EbfC family [Sulfurovum sp. 17-42-90]|nr:MAG: nucleoid-associated protein, YbaB/EbfC family [Sulfurovum sp. 17-42-90]